MKDAARPLELRDGVAGAGSCWRTTEAGLFNNPVTERWLTLFLDPRGKRTYNLFCHVGTFLPGKASAFMPGMDGANDGGVLLSRVANKITAI